MRRRGHADAGVGLKGVRRIIELRLSLRRFGTYLHFASKLWRRACLGASASCGDVGSHTAPALKLWRTNLNLRFWRLGAVLSIA